MTSESSKWIPICLSILAIVISSLSWWESHRGRVINEDINRPILTVAPIDVNTDLMSDQIPATFVIKLKNGGKAPAVLSSVTIEPFMLDGGEDFNPDIVSGVDTLFNNKLEEVVRGLSTTVLRHVKLSVRF